MRSISRLLIIFVFVACSEKKQTLRSTNQRLDTAISSTSSIIRRYDYYNALLKSRVIGRWQLVRDKKDTTVITKDSMIHIYNGKVMSSNPILFFFEDSAYKYFNAKSAFNGSVTVVENGSLSNDVSSSFKIKEIDHATSDTTDLIIIYADSLNLELGYWTGIASFRRIK